jgi:ATP-binding cassette subfamily G (WHITE) protein 2 (SNQ2)
VGDKFTLDPRNQRVPTSKVSDYLTGCTDPFEREFRPGMTEKDVPSTPEALAEAFNKSETAAQLATEMAEYHARMDEEKHVYDDFQTAVTESKRHAPKKSVYSIPFYLQVWALAKRQFLLKWQDKFGLGVSWFTSLVIAIITGTVWLNLSTTSDAAFTRGGVLFIALLFNAFQAFSELASTMLGRPIVNKHRAFSFHRPSALWIAQIGVDLLFSSAQILVFSIIVYFMTNLVRDAVLPNSWLSLPRLRCRHSSSCYHHYALRTHFRIPDPVAIRASLVAMDLLHQCSWTWLFGTDDERV